MENEKPKSKSPEGRRLAVQTLANRIDELMEKWEKENNITAEYYEELAKRHFRSSRPKSDENAL